jgi:hypothetical protein
VASHTAFGHISHGDGWLRDETVQGKTAKGVGERRCMARGWGIEDDEHDREWNLPRRR